VYIQLRNIQRKQHFGIMLPKSTKITISVKLSTRVSLKDDKMNFRRSLEPDFSRSPHKYPYLLGHAW
jgi:hypothetical protein